MAGILCLAAIVLIDAYASLMTAYLTAPKLQPIINSFEEMAESRNLKMLMDMTAPVG